MSPNPPPSTSTLRAGATRVDVTPEDLTGLDPLGESFVAVHDPLQARVLVLEEDGIRIAIVSIDAIEVGDTRALRRRIELEAGIGYDHVMIAASHTHNAPRVGYVSPGAAALAMRPEFETYTRMVEDRIVRALARTVDDLVPALLGSASGSADVNVNRDAFVGGRWVHGVAPHGPSDKTVGVLRVDSAEGDPIAVVLNYGVHPTVTLGTAELGADLAGAAAAYVEERIGGGVVALWTAGALGDQAPRISLGGASGAISGDHTPQAVDRAHREAQAQGVMVGAAAVAAAQDVAVLRRQVPLRAASRRLEFASRGPGSAMDDQAARAETVGVELTLLRIGSVALAGVGGEAVVEMLRALRARSPLRETYLVSLANDRIGYLVDEESAAKQTFEATGCPIIDPRAGEQIVSNLLDLIAETFA